MERGCVQWYINSIQRACDYCKSNLKESYMGTIKRMDMKLWTPWKFVANPKGGKPSKVPLVPVNKPDEAFTYADAGMRVGKDGYEGIGFIFTAACGVIGLDFDDCYVAGGGLVPDYERVYDELFPDGGPDVSSSPSGRGLHLYFAGSLPGVGKRVLKVGAAKVELFVASGYMTHCGPVEEGLKEYPHAVATLRAWIDAAAAAKTEPPSGVSNNRSDKARQYEALIAGGRMGLLWLGQWTGAEYGSQSEADAALMREIVWYTRDKVSALELFRLSGLHKTVLRKDKPDDYLERTYKAACTVVTGAYVPGVKSDPSRTVSVLAMRTSVQGLATNILTNAAFYGGPELLVWICIPTSLLTVEPVEGKPERRLVTYPSWKHEQIMRKDLRAAVDKARNYYAAGKA